MTITMYGKDWCGDCIRAKAYFAEHDIAYDWIDLEAHPDQTAVVLERNNGVKRIPVVVFDDDSHLVEPSNAALAAKLAELADTTTTPSPAATTSRPAAAAGGFLVTDKPEANRFEMTNDGELVGFADYRQRGTTIVMPHVETLVQHRGQGYGARLMDGLLEIIRADGRRIEPLCPFAAGHIDNDPALHDLLA